MRKTFCPLPWIHLATRPNGDVRVCCTANASGAGKTDDKEVGLVKQDGINMNLRDHTIEEVWNSEQMRNTRLQMLNDEIPSSCRKCFEEEEKGIKSKRNWETEVWNERIDVQEIVDQTQEDGTLPVNIPYFDLRLGNLCNLKCIMCSPHDSSKWVKDWKLQYPKYELIDLKQDQGWDPSFDYVWYKKSSFLDSVKNQAPHIKELYFAGGEPLLIPEHYAILQFMIDEGYAKDCILRYNSNATDISQRLLDMWEYFKEVKFNFSIDSVGEKNDYIRHPSKWDSIVSNMHLLDNTSDHITVNLACAVQLLNVHSLAELAQWKLDQNFKKINRAPYGGGIIGLHLVYLPSYLNVRVLPQDLKDQAADTISKFANSINTHEFINSAYGKMRWLGLVDYMNSEDWSHKLPAAVQYLEICDKTRELNFRNTFKELRNI
jgi:MoaA/NifB/PqqE/SkfB family radical SAM enzyme